MDIVKLEKVSKQYAGVFALDEISLTIKRGGILALIGQNGAGKTTLMRIITTLTKPSGGKVELFGEASESKKRVLMKKIGCIIEAPALLLNMTGPQNLEFYRLRRGIANKAIINELLSKVGLKIDNKKKVVNYSLGMKQRLGIAMCLMHEPELLVLDEPANGLDPTGMVELRNLLKHLNVMGITVLVSSHLLTELTHIASDYVIIHKGRILESLSAEELAGKTKKSIVFAVDAPEKALDLLSNSFGFNDINLISGNEIEVRDNINDIAEINIQFAQAGIKVTSIRNEASTVEDYYINLVGEAG